MGANYPNPFNPSTLIPYQLAASSYVRLEVFNLLGQRIATLVEGERSAGSHAAVWDATDASGQAVGAGVYLYRLTVGGAHQTGRMVLVDGQAGVSAVGGDGVWPVGVAQDRSYGLVVSGSGIAPYVVADLGIQAGMAPVELVVEAHPAGKALGDDGSLFDLFDLFNTLKKEAEAETDTVKMSGPKIEGPWLWMIVPTGDKGGPAAAASGIDWLAEVSGGAVTEQQIAKNGAVVGDPVGNKVWTWGKLTPTSDNNITEMVQAIGLGNGYIVNHVAYGWIALDAPQQQNTTMYVGSDDAVKVWLNGTLVHDNPADRAASDYQDEFPVTLKQGKNSLLVAVYQGEFYWSGFFGFEDDTAYSYQRGPDLVVSSASASDTTLSSGQAFTLNAKVRNQGDGQSAATTLRYYLSTDATITSDDEAVGTDAIGALNPSAINGVLISLTAPVSAGMYYYGACVESVSGESDTDNNCSSAVSVAVSSGGSDDHGDTRSGATSLSLGSSLAGQLETGGDVDYFRVQVAGSGTLTVYTSGSVDTKGELENSAGTTLASDDDGGSRNNFHIEHSVSAGTYYIKVAGYNSSTTGSYTIRASGPSGGRGDGPVTIPDANLRAVLEEALSKSPNAPITPAEMATLTVIYANDKGIRDLTGLEFATNLIHLRLHDNSISDISPLSGLINLTDLDLGGNSLSDISPLSRLTNLTWLNLNQNSISDISPLSGLTNLTSYLGLGINSISDISPLSGLTNLTWLDLDINSISDLSPLVGLTNLIRLNLDQNSISDLSPLSGLTNLIRLDLAYNSISDISPLSSSLTNLIRLLLVGNRISDISPLVANTGLGSGDTVYLSGNPLSITSLNTHIPALQSRGVTVFYEP